MHRIIRRSSSLAVDASLRAACMHRLVLLASSTLDAHMRCNRSIDRINRFMRRLIWCGRSRPSHPCQATRAQRTYPHNLSIKTAQANSSMPLPPAATQPQPRPRRRPHGTQQQQQWQQQQQRLRSLLPLVLLLLLPCCAHAFVHCVPPPRCAPRACGPLAARGSRSGGGGNRQQQRGGGGGGGKDGDSSSSSSGSGSSPQAEAPAAPAATAAEAVKEPPAASGRASSQRLLELPDDTTERIEVCVSGFWGGCGCLGWGCVYVCTGVGSLPKP